LREHGYKALALAGGYDAWRDTELPLDKPNMAKL
jgi:rhodanese-related sulfurtransferase